ncbi:MAG TPA: aminoglycoside adenylyltransferase domain-containing protein [Gemmatimonadales bacterium]|nr:aminoglycoside adenylyltransferase domain-containing protein [Gemmatimonadales bacterium]
MTDLLDHLGAGLQADLGRNVVGLYVYGSLTQGAFDPRRSDVDCVTIIRRPLRPSEERRLRVSLRQLRARHPWMRRLQMTILIRRELLRFNGQGWLFQFGRLTRPGSDGNPIIWANLLESGRVVFGPAPRTLVRRIPRHLMHAALAREITYLRVELITNPRSVWRRRATYRRYAALTACRILYTLATGRVTSKPRAAAWALRRLPSEHRAIVRRAASGSGGRLPLGPLRALVEHVERRLGNRTHQDH